MTTRYTCHHHKAEERTYGEIIMRTCGCDGTTHYACQPRRAPRGTPRPADWPARLGWNTTDMLDG
jgi:hypothetical protein